MKTGKVRDSYIVRFFRFLTQLVYDALALGVIGRFFSAYDTSNGLFRRSRTGRMFEKAERGGGRIYCLMRRNIALAIDQSLLRRAVWHLADALLLASLRIVGVFSLTAGTYSVIMYLLFFFVWHSEMVGAIHLYAGCAALLLGILLLFFDNSIGYSLQKSLLFRKLLMPLLGISDERLKEIPKRGTQGVYIAVPLGMLVGALSALTSPFYMLLASLILLLALAVLAAPETGVLLLLLLLPFIGFLPNGTVWLAVLVGLTLMAYFVKLLRGNRAFHLDVQDFAVLLLLFVTVLSGVSLAGVTAWRGALLSALMITAYFFTVNLIATPRWLVRSRTVLITSATIASFVGIVQFILAAVNLWGRVPLSTLGSFVCAGFVDRTTFAYFLLIAFPFALSAFLRGKKQYQLLSGLSLLTIFFATVLTWMQSAWVALAAMIVVFALIHEKRFFPFLLTAAALTPVAYLILPPKARNAFLELMQTNASETMLKSASASTLASHIFFDGRASWGGRGVTNLLFGIGNGGFESICLLYTGLPYEEAAQSFNFWLYRLLENGLLGILIPAILFLLVLQNCFSLLRVGANAKKPMSPTVGVAMVVGALVHGIFRYAWYDYAALTAFFMFLALIGADARYQRRQREVDSADDQQ